MAGKEDKNIWTKWYWQDFESDTGLRLCSLEAQGLWMRMLSIMAKSNRKGYLLENDKAMTEKSLARLVGTSVSKVKKLIGELEHYGVFSRDSQGVIYNRRMVREAEISKKRSLAGSLGGKAKAKKLTKLKQVKSKSIAKDIANGGANSLAPSVSASVSASASVSEYNLNNNINNNIIEKLPEIPANLPFKVRDKLIELKLEIAYLSEILNNEKKRQYCGLTEEEVNKKIKKRLEEFYKILRCIR